MSAPPEPAHTLSVLIPVFNEVDTIAPLIERVLAARIDIPKQVLVVDDGSTDGTRDLLDDLRGTPDLDIEFLDENIGRGGVIKHLWPKAVGDVIVHQDADLEYDPAEYSVLLEPILAGEADVVYGSRFKGSIEKMRGLNRAGNQVMTATTRLLYGVDISDLMTCYKMYRRELVEGLHISADRFDFEAELTARLVQRGARFGEVPISFTGRTFEEGKKIRMTDALFVTSRLLTCRFSRARAVV